MRDAKPTLPLCRQQRREQARRQPLLDAEEIGHWNRQMPAGYSVAVLHQPPKVRGGWSERRTIALKLPRSGQGQARRDVHIPPPSFCPPRQPRISKHARQKAKYGCHGSGERTIARKLDFLATSLLQALILSARRTRRRAYTYWNLGFKDHASRYRASFVRAMDRLFDVIGRDRAFQEVAGS